MITKEELIKEAWGELMPDYTSINMSHGWSEGVFDIKEIDLDNFDRSATIIGFYIRPKSLKGIDDNNGWISISSEDDLPKEIGQLYWVIKNGYKYPIHAYLYNNDSTYWMRKYTHYQPIIKPKMPLHK